MKTLIMNQSIVGTLLVFLILGLLPINSSVQAQTPVTGSNVTEVKYGKTTVVEGILRQVGPKTWNQYLPDGKTLYTTHTETKRDKEFVYLTGKVYSSTVINVSKNTIEFKTPSGAQYIGKALSLSNAAIPTSKLTPTPTPGVIIAGPVYISSGNCPVGQSWGLYTKASDNGCLPKVEFHLEFNLSFEEAQTIAVKNGWVMATAEEVKNAWTQLELNHFAYGMLYDGSFAVPVQKDHPPNIKRGANIGITGENQGFFYVKKEAVSRVQVAPQTAKVPPPTKLDGGEWIPGKSILKDPQCNNEATRSQCITEVFQLADERIFGRRAELLCDSSSGNPMLEGWGTGYKPVLEDAARLLLGKERISATPANINRLQAQLSTDPVRRWQFAPFMLRTMWSALVAKNPNEAQADFRQKFEKWAACDETKIAKMTLALWNNHIGKSDSISGTAGLRIRPPKPYKEITLSVLLDMSDRGSIKGFLPLENPFFLGPKAEATVALLYKPMMAHSLPNFDDTENLRSLGNDMSNTALDIGITTAGFTVLAVLAGAPILTNEITTVARTIAGNKSIKAKDLGNLADDLAKAKIDALVKEGVPYDEAVKKFGSKVASNVAKESGEEIGESAAKQGIKNLAKKIWGQTLKESLEEAAEKSAKKAAKKGGELAAKKAGELAAKKVAAETAKFAATKVVAALAVVGVIATMGEIFVTVIADAAKTDQFDKNLNKTASTVGEYNVEKFLGKTPGQFQKSTVFNQLVKMTIADPADVGSLTLALPPIKCEIGTKATRQGTCIPEVKFHSQVSLTLEQAEQVAVNNGWELATEDEVADAWYYHSLDVYAFGRMANGRFAVPVISDHSNFKFGPNLGATGGNQGFFYTVKPIPPAEEGFVRLQSLTIPNKYIYNQFNKLEFGGIQPKWTRAMWKIVPFRGQGLFLFQSRLDPKTYLHYQNGKLEVGPLKPNNPNQEGATWEFSPVGNGRQARIKAKSIDINPFENNDKEELYLHCQNGILELGPIQPNWESAIWIVK